MTTLATTLGIPPSTISIHDIYSLPSPTPTFDPFSHIPRPCLALLAIIPPTPTWSASRTTEDAPLPPIYPHSGQPSEPPIIWFKQTIGHACGSIGLLHCLINSPVIRDLILPGSVLDDIRRKAIPLNMVDRAQMLYDHPGFEAAHKSVQTQGDTDALDTPDGAGGHFVAFVKGDDGRFWELEGDRRGPIERGRLEDGEDVLSDRALDMGIRRIINMEREACGDDLRFSCIALSRVGGE